MCGSLLSRELSAKHFANNQRNETASFASFELCGSLPAHSLDMTAAVMEMSQPAFSFPLKPKAQSHSRKYTVDLGGLPTGLPGGLPVGLPAGPASSLGVADAGSANSTVATTPTAANGLLAAPRQGRHAHKRSGAISHDFSAPDGAAFLHLASPSPTFSSRSAFGAEHRNNSPYDAASPALTFTSSNSSLPYQSAVSLATSETSTGGADGASSSKPASPQEPNAPGKRVSFAGPQAGQLQQQQQPRASLRSASSTEHARPEETTKDRKRRHKKVKSWAGGFLKLHLHRKAGGGANGRANAGANAGANTNRHGSLSPDEPVQAAPADTEPRVAIVGAEEFHSSSYIPARASVMCDEDVAGPVIDLDAALGPFKTPTTLRATQAASEMFSFSFHRRTESAPEYMSNRTSGMKRKMGPVVEEEDETEAAEAAAAASQKTIGGNPSSLVRQRSLGLASVSETEAMQSPQPETPSMACDLGEPGPEVVRYSTDVPPSVVSGATSVSKRSSSRTMGSRVMRLLKLRSKQP